MRGVAFRAVGFFASRPTCRRRQAAAQEGIYLGTALRIDIAHLGAIELRSGDVAATRSLLIGNALVISSA